MTSTVAMQTGPTLFGWSPAYFRVITSTHIQALIEDQQDISRRSSSATLKHGGNTASESLGPHIQVELALAVPGPVQQAGSGAGPLAGVSLTQTPGRTRSEVATDRPSHHLPVLQVEGNSSATLAAPGAIVGLGRTRRASLASTVVERQGETEWELPTSNDPMVLLQALTTGTTACAPSLQLPALVSRPAGPGGGVDITRRSGTVTRTGIANGTAGLAANGPRASASSTRPDALQVVPYPGGLSQAQLDAVPLALDIANDFCVRRSVFKVMQAPLHRSTIVMQFLDGLEKARQLAAMALRGFESESEDDGNTNASDVDESTPGTGRSRAGSQAFTTRGSIATRRTGGKSAGARSGYGSTAVSMRPIKSRAAMLLTSNMAMATPVRRNSSAGKSRNNNNNDLDSSGGKKHNRLGAVSARGLGGDQDEPAWDDLDEAERQLRQIVMRRLPRPIDATAPYTDTFMGLKVQSCARTPGFIVAIRAC